MYLYKVRTQLSVLIKQGVPISEVPFKRSLWQPRVEIEHYSVAFFIVLLCSKHCSTELPLRAGLVHSG